MSAGTIAGMTDWLYRHDRPAHGLLHNWLGSGCFLICGGPSIRHHDTRALRRPGILTAAVNNAPLGTGDSPETILRPDFWFCVDRPGHFHQIIWTDPGIAKFVQRKCDRETYRVRHRGRWVGSGVEVKTLPNVFSYEMHERFDPETFLDHPCPTWGTKNRTDPFGQGRRSVMLVAIYCLYWLGVRRIYLLGCDFGMDQNRPYGWDEAQEPEHWQNSNQTYRRLNDVWFPALKPHLRQKGLAIYNCTPGGGLTAFKRVRLADAVRNELRLGDVPDHTRSGDLYLRFDPKENLRPANESLVKISG